VLGEVCGCGIEAFAEYGPHLEEPHPDVLLGPALAEELLAPERGLRRLWEEPGFDVDACAAEVKVVQAQIERLGAVNVEAVQELEAEEEQFVFLEKEVADLAESRRSIMETLRRLEVQSRALFEATFEQARANFQAIFRKLFQGGRADMQLVEGEDSLEAGIDIVAKPPGKELQSINLLSGGERSLTALAILFAVFKVKPSPFCILDEVDAALDDTNVERFLRVLQEFVGPTQFCVVTHHKRTMAACQMLYGITMQKRGVSSRIAVSLEQVDGVYQGQGGRGVPAATDRRIAGEEAVGFEG
jgi:chromosome segregation protein